MNIDDLLTLVRAGYSKEEIAKLEASAVPPADTPTADPVPPAEPNAQTAPAAAAPAEPAEPQLNKMQAMIDRLASALHVSNINNSAQPAENPNEAEDALFNLIH